MGYTYEELKNMTVAEMREVASKVEHEAVKGYTQLNKEHLLKALCNALDIEMKVHHEVVGLDKAGIKSRIKHLKEERDLALNAKDHVAVKKIRHNIHSLKRRIHKATV